MIEAEVTGSPHGLEVEGERKRGERREGERHREAEREREGERKERASSLGWLLLGPGSAKQVNCGAISCLWGSVGERWGFGRTNPWPAEGLGSSDRWEKPGSMGSGSVGTWGHGQLTDG